ncbi:MAG: PAS domain S-box protein [Bacteroidales bacterium]|jgi:PAS domain S-box-containing protein|nr:PAS domain S-box protein [Bacteroidales bacterium]
MSVLVPDDLIPEQKETFQKLKKVKSISNYETIRKAKNNNRIPVEMSVSVMHNNAGDEIGTTEIIRDITERKTAVLELEKSEEHYRLLFNVLPYSCEIFDTKGRIIDCNPSTVKMFGYEKNELIGQLITNFVDEDTIKSFQSLFPKILNGEKVSSEATWVHKNGSNINIIRSAAPILDSNGKVEFIFGLSVDITERKQMEESLLMKDYAVASSINAIVITDMEGVVVYLNDATVKMWGYKNEDELIGRNLIDFWDGEGIYQTMEALEKKGFRFGEDIGKKFDGSVFPVQFSASIVKDYEGNPIYIFGSFIDITERKQTEGSLRKSEEFNRQIIENSSDCIKVLDLTGNLQYMSPGGQKLLEVKNIQNYIGKSWINFFKDVDRKAAQKAVKEGTQGKSSQIKVYLPTEKGNPKWWDAIVSPIIGTDGKPINLLVLSRDITFEVQFNKELTESEEKFRNLVTSMDDLVFGFDENKRFTYYHSPKSETLFVKPEDFIGKIFSEIMAPHINDLFEKAYNKAKSGKSSTFEYDMEIEGIKKWYSARISPVILNNNFSGALAIMRNISEIKKAEEEILKLNTGLEQKVKERTAEQEKTLKEVERMNELFVGREFRIKELRDEIEQLKQDKR